MDDSIHARTRSENNLKQGGLRMKARVLNRFRDKHTCEIHEPGKILTISRERFEEILTVAPLVEEITEPKKKKEAAK